MAIQEHPGTQVDPPEAISPSDARYQAARQRAAALQGFYIHALVYMIANAGLFVINAVTRGSSGNWWFYWPLGAWGVALVIHAATTFVGVFSPDWVDRRARRLLQRDERRQGV